MYMHTSSIKLVCISICFLHSLCFHLTTFVSCLFVNEGGRLRRTGSAGFVTDNVGGVHHIERLIDKGKLP